MVLFIHFVHIWYEVQQMFADVDYCKIAEYSLGYHRKENWDFGGFHWLFSNYLNSFKLSIKHSNVKLLTLASTG